MEGTVDRGQAGRSFQAHGSAMPITLRQLEIFIAVAETQQVTKASKKLFLTQSAVSMALAELENQLGGLLFDRQGRSLLLNDRGRYLLPLGQDIISQVNNVESLMSEHSGSLAGSLRIVASSTIGNYLLPYLIGFFIHRHPNVNIDMLVVNTKVAEELIVDGNYDLGFVEGAVSSERLQIIPWFQDELVIFAGPTHDTASRDHFRIPEDLKKCRWIMREEGSGTAQIFKSKLGEHASDLRVVMKLGHSEAIKKAVESGAGVGCLSILTICREMEHGWLKRFQVDGVDMHRQLLMIHRKNKAKTRLINKFMDFCSIMTECSQSRKCLTSPWKLQDLLANYDETVDLH